MSAPESPFQSPRLRRLEDDARQIASMFSGSQFVRVDPVGPAPAERYRITYLVASLWHDKATNALDVRRQHIVDITLPPGYPREKPYCTTPNPIWHPNFGAYICIADHWLPSQTLADVIALIGELLQFKAYNIRSPLNALAAKWATDNAHRLPLSDADLRAPETRVRIL